MLSKNREILYNKACKSYQDFSQEEKNKNRQSGRDRFENLSEDGKQNLVEYKKSYKIGKNKNPSQTNMYWCFCNMNNSKAVFYNEAL